jgi:hypothetical protein
MSDTNPSVNGVSILEKAIPRKSELAVNTLDILVQRRKNKKSSGKDFLKEAQTVKVFNQKNNNR